MATFRFLHCADLHLDSPLRGLEADPAAPSERTRAETSNLAEEYPTADKDRFNIGLLHTSIDGRVGHDTYAPCSVDQLRGHGYQYWALGHVHRREVLSEAPWIVFSGNLQGRHINE